MSYDHASLNARKDNSTDGNKHSGGRAPLQPADSCTSEPTKSLRERISQDLQLRGMAQRTHDGVPSKQPLQCDDCGGPLHLVEITDASGRIVYSRPPPYADSS